MKKILFSSLAILLIATAQAQPTKTIVHDVNAEARTIGSFKGIQVSGGITVYLSQGTTEAIAISTDEAKNNNKVKTEVKNGILKIYMENGSWNTWSWKSKSVKAYVTVKNLESIEASGACAVRLSDNLNTNNLKLDLSGASSFKGDITANTIRLDLSGASSATISGKATNAIIDASGASSIKAYDFEVEDCKAEASGASSIGVGVSKNLQAEASGASSIRYKGDPAIKNIAATGASSVKKKDS